MELLRPASIAASNAPRSLRKENFRRRCWPCEIACWLTIEPERAAPLWAVLSLLLTYSSEVVAQGSSQALICGTLDPAAIALLVRQRTAPQPRPAAPILALRAPDGMQRPVVNLARYDLATLAEGRP